MTSVWPGDTGNASRMTQPMALDSRMRSGGRVQKAQELSKVIESKLLILS